MKNKFIRGISLSLLLTLGSFSFASCSNTELTLKATKQTLVIGEEVNIEVSKGNISDYLLKSSDESILTVSEDGVVKAISEGSAIITALNKSDFSDQATYQFFVNESSGDSFENKKNLEIDTTSVKTLFKQGEEFSCENLIVKIDGTSVTSFTTNPKEGTILNTIGELTVYVSVSGYNSASYVITVTENSDDYSLYDLAETLSNTNAYHYKVIVEGSVSIDDTGAIYDGLTYDYIYGENSFYLKFVAGEDTIVEDYDFGYVNTSIGVMKYKLTDDTITPISYLSHKKTNYREASAYTDKNEFDLETLPLRTDSSGAYLVNNATLSSKLITMTDLSSSTITNNLKDIKGYVLSDDSFEFVLNCGQVGNVRINFSEIGSAKVTLAENYINEGNETIDPDEDLVSAVELLKGNNFTTSLGSFTDSDGTTKSRGYTYFTENYYVVEYSDNYLTYYNSNNQDTLLSYGYYYESSSKTVYYFNIEKDENNLKSITNYQSVKTRVKSLQDYSGVYPVSLDPLDESNLDMYEYTYIDSFGISAYLNSGDSAGTEVYTFYGYTTSLYIIPSALGIYYYEGASKELSTVTLFAYCFDFSLNYYALGYAYSNFGITSYSLLENYIA